MKRAAVAVCLLGLAVAAGAPRASARSALRHKCPSFKSLQRRGLLPKTLDAKTRRPKALNAQARLLVARAQSAYRALQFQRALDYLCVLVEHQRLARHPRRPDWSLLYANQLARHRYLRQAIEVVEREFAKPLKRRSLRIFGPGGRRLLRAVLLLSRWRTYLARRERRPKRRRKLYRKALPNTQRAVRAHLSFVNAVGGKRMAAGRRPNNAWPRLTKKRLRKDAMLSLMVLGFAESLTLAWEALRATGLTPTRADVLERLSDDVIQLFWRLPRGPAVQRAAAQALGWFDLRRALARLTLPRINTLPQLPNLTPAALIRSTKYRGMALFLSRGMVMKAIQGVERQLSRETSRVHTLMLSLGRFQEFARAQTHLGALYERAAAQVASPRWPDPAAEYVRLLAPQYSDPKSFMDKIAKLVFGSPTVYEGTRRQWLAQARRFYRRVVRRGRRGLATAPWTLMAQRRLAKLRGNPVPHCARVANRTAPRLTLPKGIDKLLEPVAYPPPLTASQLRAAPRLVLRPLPRRRPRAVAGAGGLPPSYRRNLSARLRKKRHTVARLLHRALAAEKSRNHTRARKALRKAAALSPRSRRVLTALGRVQLRLVDISGALRTAARLELAGHDQAAEQLRKRLRKLVR